MTPRAGPHGSTFSKQRPGAPAAYYRIEAAGLAWLNVPGGPPVAPVVAVAADRLELARIRPAMPSPDSFSDFGRRLACLHASGAEAFGVAPAGVSDAAGYLADLTLPFGRWADFETFYAEARMEPYLRMLRDDGRMPSAAAAVFDALLRALTDTTSGLAGPPEPPSRIHGDLWSGNVMWSAAGPGEAVTGWLIDPAAHGGHRETDLAMLALFGLPGLDQVLAGYHQQMPLAPGWRGRVPLHQVHPLLVHAVLFGGGYLTQARAAAAAALRAS